MNHDPEPVSQLPAEPRGTAVRDAIARRVSCRAYQSKPVSEAQVMQILEAARLAPSACNQQPWRFAVVPATICGGASWKTASCRRQDDVGD